MAMSDELELERGQEAKVWSLKLWRCVGMPMWGSKEEGKKKHYRGWTRLVGVGVHQRRAKSERSFSELDVWMNECPDGWTNDWMDDWIWKLFSLDFSFATFVRISVGPKCCNNLAALEQIILFLEMLKFKKKKKKHSQRTQYWEEKWRIFGNIHEYVIWKMEISKIINYLMKIFIYPQNHLHIHLLWVIFALEHAIYFL